MSKKLVIFGLFLIMVFSFVACEETNLQKIIGEQAEKIELQNDKIKNLQKVIEEQAEKIKQQNDKIKNLENELKNRMEDDVVKERWDDGYPNLTWAEGKVEVLVTFPRIIEQGDKFSLTITTTNISGEDIEYQTSGSFVDCGVCIRDIKYSKPEYFEWLVYRHIMGDSFRIAITSLETVIIPKGQSVTYTWQLEATYLDCTNPFKPATVSAPKGKYDVYLDNGEVYRNAIIIV